jgi:hypothetical protein
MDQEGVSGNFCEKTCEFQYFFGSGDGLDGPLLVLRPYVQRVAIVTRCRFVNGARKNLKT